MKQKSFYSYYLLRQLSQRVN